MIEKTPLLTLQLMKNGSIDKKKIKKKKKIQQILKTPTPSKYVNANLINDFVIFINKTYIN